MTPALERDADRPGEQKGDRHREHEITIDPCRRQKGAEQLLANIGGVGAQHDHLTMRHIDYAHDAKRDRQPDCGEQ